MDVIPGRAASTLNPHAPPFVPAAYRAVKGFSSEWWRVVESSACFRDDWPRECFQEPAAPAQNDDPDLLLDMSDLVLPDTDSLFHSYPSPQLKNDRPSSPISLVADAEKESRAGEVVAWWGAEEWRRERGRYDDPKMVNSNVSQQLRWRGEES